MHKDANFEQLEFYLKESLIMYQTIEAVLKDYIENAWRLQAASTPYLLKTAPEKAIKKLQTKTMGTLIEHFADLSLNENLISNLQSLNKTRNSIAHGRFYKINMKRIKDEFSEEELNKACVEFGNECDEAQRVAKEIVNEYGQICAHYKLATAIPVE